RQCCLRPHVFPLRRQCRLYREPVCPLRNRSHGGRPRMAGVLPGAERHPRRRDDERRGAVIAGAPPAAAGGPPRRRRARGGDWGELERSLGDKVKVRAQAAGVDFSAAEVQQTTRDSIRTLMLIRAYRARGHFYANLDPLGLEPHHDEEDLNPRSYGFTEADY